MAKLNFKRMLGLCLLTLSLTGCVAAVPLLTVVGMVPAGFGIFKAVQMTTGGTVQVAFSETDIPDKDKMALLSITKPTIWPGDAGPVYIANALEASGEFSTIVTPSTIARILTDWKIDQNIHLMTDAERLRIFGRICEKSGADAMIAFRGLGVEMESNIWSFKRMASTVSVEMMIYSYELDRIIYTTELRLIFDIGVNMPRPNQPEILQIAGEAAAEKFIQLRKSSR